MTLLDASTALVDACRDLPAADSKRSPLGKAIRRMEKRIEVLRARRAKFRECCQWKAWGDACVVIGQYDLQAKAKGECGLPTCHQCQFQFDPATFFKHAEVCGRGHITRLYCPKCDTHLVGHARPDQVPDFSEDEQAAKDTAFEEPWLPRHLLTYSLTHSPTHPPL